MIAFQIEEAVVSADTNETRYEVWTDFNQRVPMRDGVTLSADIYRPKAEGRFPIILQRTPYLKTSPQALKTARYFAERGFVYVWMDVRGRGDSDGVFVPYRNDGRDGYDAIEWCAVQEWSNGNVGTIGGSYAGRVQWLAALEQPPHLRSMIVLVTPSDPFVEWPTGTGGPMRICWIHMTSGRALQNTDAVDWNAVYEHLPMTTMDERAGRYSAQWREELSHERLDDYWKVLCYQDKFDRVNVPVLHISGWYDDELIGTPLNFQGMVANGATPEARSNQKLLIGPWGHSVNKSSVLGEVDFGQSALIDLNGYQTSWFERWLTNKQNGIDQEPPVRMFVMGENRWRDENEWPLARTQETSFYLHSAGKANSRFGDGTLSLSAPSEAEPSDNYSYDPARWVPFLTDPISTQIGGPDDYAAVQRRDDVLVYMTPPLEEELEVTGHVRVELFASSSAPDTDFMAMLLDVHPNGFVQRLCDGMVRARFRDGMENPTLIEPGEVYQYQIDCWATSQLFRKGHRIALQIASSAFPKYERNLNTGESIANGTRMEIAAQQIFHDAERPSRLILPIIPAKSE
jgi:putative CocE/NonD family hydrolase